MKTKRTREDLKRDIVRLQVELMENSGYTDEEIKAHKSEAQTKPPKYIKARRTK